MITTNDELERVWKEMILHYFKALSQCPVEGLRKTRKISVRIASFLTEY
jgi:hypothetical protein